MKKLCLLFSTLSYVAVGQDVEWYNIWDEKFSEGNDRDFYLYYTGITQGLKLTTHYTNFSKCSSDGIIAMLDSVYDWYVVYETDTDKWEDYVGEVFYIIADHFSEFYYYCSLAANDVVEVNEEKFDEFQGIDDIYTSFLFNLLEESLQIQATAESLQEAEAASDWVEFAGDIATLINLILDFESASAAANPSTITDPQQAYQFFQEEKPMTPIKVAKNRARFERTVNQNKDQIVEVTRALKSFIEATQNPAQVAQKMNLMQDDEDAFTEDLNFFGWFFYLLLGFIDGVLNGFPDSTAMGDCKDHLDDIREDFEDGIEYYAEDDIEQGAEKFQSGLADFGELWDDCYLGYEENIDDDELFTDYIPTKLLWNIFYNAGFLLVDALYILETWNLSRDPEVAIPYHYAFFSGDFAMRFIYSEYDP